MAYINGKEILFSPVIDTGDAETQTKTVNITANGTKTINPDSGYLLSKVIVNTNVPSEEATPTQAKTVNITANGSTVVKPDSGYALSQVTVNTAVPAATSDIFKKTVEKSLTEITATDLNGFTLIGDYVFALNKSLKTVTIPDSVKSINKLAFDGCLSLANVTIGNSVTHIGGMVFGNCTSLTNINLPASITSIGTNAFQGCTNLTDIYVGWAEGKVANAPWGAPNATIHYVTDTVTGNEYAVDFNLVTTDGSSIGAIAINHSNSDEAAELKAGNVVLYKYSADSGEFEPYTGAKFNGTINIHSMDGVGDAASVQGTFVFYHPGVYRIYGVAPEMDVYTGEAITEVVTITVGGNTITPPTEGMYYELSTDGTYYILTSASDGGWNATEIVIPTEYNGLPVTEIGTYAFGECVMSSVTIPNSITTIGDNAFGDCNSLQDIYVGWAEGAVEGAPWGATYATIHYNYEV